MEALEAMTARRSVRQYLDRPVDRGILERLVDAGRLAPTARNEQPWDFVVVTDRSVLKQIGALADHGRFIADAGACIEVICREVKYYLEDGCAATENILIAAAALGVDSCWVAGDKKPYGADIMKMLNVPEGYKVISLLALGYRAAEPKPYTKRELSSVLHWERF
jgi:nitroreductase